MVCLNKPVTFAALSRKQQASNISIWWILAALIRIDPLIKSIGVNEWNIENATV